MKTSTRILATASAAAMMLSLAACGLYNNNTDPSNAGSDSGAQPIPSAFAGMCNTALDQATGRLQSSSDRHAG